MNEALKGTTGIFKEEESNAPENFGLLLKHYRGLRNFSLKDLESGSGVSAGYIHRLENGERNSPSINKILALAKALRIPSTVLVATLIHGLEEEERPFSLSEVLIQNSYFLGSGMLNTEAKQLLIQLVEYIAEAEWSPKSKMREMYELSELIDQLKKAMN